MKDASFDSTHTLLPYVHVLDLDSNGWVLPCFHGFHARNGFPERLHTFSHPEHFIRVVTQRNEGRKPEPQRHDWVAVPVLLRARSNIFGSPRT